MEMRHFSLILALAVAAAGEAPARPQRADEASALPEPSEEALALARELGRPRIFLFDLATERVRAAIEQDLLNPRVGTREPPCDPELEACVAAARAIARREAPLHIARMRAMIERMTAIHLERRLAPAELREARQFMRQPAGRKLAEALIELGGLDAGAPGLEPHYEMAMRAINDRNRSLHQEFHDRTSALPRARLQPIEAPPLPPRPPPRPPEAVPRRD